MNLLLGHGRDGVGDAAVPGRGAMLCCAVLHSAARVQYLAVSVNIKKVQSPASLSLVRTCGKSFLTCIGIMKKCAALHSVRW